MNNLFALLQGKDSEIVNISGSRVPERDQATDEETKVQANAHNKNDSVFALILNAMGTKAAEVSDKIEKAGVHKQPEGTEMLKVPVRSLLQPGIPEPAERNTELAVIKGSARWC